MWSPQAAILNSAKKFAAWPDEGSMAAVSCLDAGENGCERAAKCLTLPMWKKLDAVMDNYLSGVSVQDLLDGKA